MQQAQQKNREREVKVFGHCLECHKLKAEAELVEITLLEEGAGEGLEDGIVYICRKCYKKAKGNHEPRRVEMVDPISKYTRGENE